MDNQTIIIGNTLRGLRNRSGLTMEQLAEKLDVSRQSIAKWENDECLPDLMKCARLAQIYNVTIDAIINSSIEQITQASNDGKKYIFGFVTVGARGQISLPKKARTLFEINSGDNLLVLGDKAQNGLAIVKVDVVDDLIALGK